MVTEQRGKSEEEARQVKKGTGADRREPRLPVRGRSGSESGPAELRGGAGQEAQKPEVRHDERNKAGKGNVRIVTPM